MTRYLGLGDFESCTTLASGLEESPFACMQCAQQSHPYFWNNGRSVPSQSRGRGENNGISSGSGYDETVMTTETMCGGVRAEDRVGIRGQGTGRLRKRCDEIDDLIVPTAASE